MDWTKYLASFKNILEVFKKPAELPWEISAHRGCAAHLQDK